MVAGSMAELANGVAAGPSSASGARPLPGLAQFRRLVDGAPIVIDLDVESLDEAVEALTDALVNGQALTREQGDALVESALAREQEESTALGEGVAVPHGFLDDVDGPCLAVARLAHPLELGGPDGEPSSFVYLLCCGTSDPVVHLELLMSIARLASDARFTAEAYDAPSGKDWLRALDDYLDRSVEEPPPPPVERDDGLAVRGFMRGVIEDLRRRAPHYLSDFRDGLHPKSLAATLFLFFACVAPAVAFGGLMAQLTGGAIGAMEMIVATAIGGVIYALFAGQPLTILGGTGPLLVFTGVLYELCGRMGLPFLPVYAWVGLWTGAFTVIAAVTNASRWIRYCTRFTDEIFAVLISVIFIYEAIKNVLAVFSNEAIDDHSALMSLVLALLTFYVALSLRNVRASSYLRHRVREFLADFGSVIAIGAATFVAVVLHEGGLPHLAVPDTIATTSGRPWLVDVWSVPAWVIVACTVPAVLCTVLVYLDQNITARLVNQSGHRLEKGAAYHHDLLMVGGLPSPACRRTASRGSASTSSSVCRCCCFRG
jgi:mannitol/fructose-specific phosphotransferase system IIA component (Ntr-type)